MKIIAKISPIAASSLEQIVSNFNSWPYRTDDIKLNNQQLSIELADLPIFWEDFLTDFPVLRNQIKPNIIDAMRKIALKDIGISFNKAMAAIHRSDY